MNEKIRGLTRPHPNPPSAFAEATVDKGEGETSATILRIRTTELAEHSAAKPESFDRYSFSSKIAP
jgi:hypothetical protein